MPAEIVGLGTAVPTYVLTNSDLEQLVDTNDQWITERTGVKERRIAGRGESTSTLGKAAALRALESAGLGVDDVVAALIKREQNGSTCWSSRPRPRTTRCRRRPACCSSSWA